MVTPITERTRKEEAELLTVIRDKIEGRIGSKFNQGRAQSVEGVCLSSPWAHQGCQQIESPGAMASSSHAAGRCDSPLAPLERIW